MMSEVRDLEGETMSEHALPWTWDGTFPIRIRDSEGYIVVSAKGVFPPWEPKAKFIVRACNSHEELLQAVRAADMMLVLLPVRDEREEAARIETRRILQAAIAKADGR